MRNSEIRSEAAPRLALNGSGSPAGQKGEGAREQEDQLVRLFNELRVPVFRYLRRIGLSSEDSEDVVQEAFLRLFRRLRERGQEENLRGWVYRVAHNLAIDRCKRQRRLSTRSLQEWTELCELLIDEALNPEELLIGKERIAVVNRAIGTLSHRQRQCLFLRMEGFRYREIGERLGMKVSTVAASLRRAKEKLRANEMKWPGEDEFGARVKISLAAREMEWSKPEFSFSR
jgi:RNA polymerase sigma-70 factor (ECF subfamily)